MESEHGIGVDRGWQVGNEEVSFRGYRIFESDENVLEMDSGDGCTVS